MRCIGLLFCLALLVLLASASAIAQQKLDIDPLELVRRAAHNEIKADSTQYYCMFKDKTEYKDHSITREVIRTPQGGLSETVTMNGHPLSADERKKEDAKLAKFANNPDARAKRRESSKADDKRAETMLTSLTDAFLYTYVGTDAGPNGEELVHLKFRPNPTFTPPNHETMVYLGMQGDLIIDRKAMRIAKIDGTLFKDVDFGWGILGRLDKGGKFIVVQQDVGVGHWEEVQETLQFTGKILLIKSLTIWSTETMTDFRPVPDDLTTAQALEMLHKTAEVVADNGAAPKQAQNNNK
jgi:hypothetical protein